MIQYSITAYQTDAGKWRAGGMIYEEGGTESEFEFPAEDEYATQKEAEDAARAYFQEQGYTEKKS